MRISKIKLTGFKSFVDPTVLTLSGNLTGIVGPNGCGKSNIIDAILWVMGESSARHLRGDSMADVIFNGSNSRRPVGQATVEIIFDNSDGALGGQYASYAELSIKRQLSRDGVSGYYLNGTRCRRRDITDIFLGTGLGPRSYAVIEQGMISRIIEAKPEELRVFLEEAAGISKYKERRRETENRLHHTNENLNRLNDIRNELDKQLNHLGQQAKAAEKYQKLKEQERRVKAELIALVWRDLQQQAESQRRLTLQCETAMERELAQLREIEVEIEKTRQSHGMATDRFNEVQHQYYAISAEVSRLEQAIQHARERRQALERDLHQASQDLSKAHEHLGNDQLKLAQLAEEIQASEPEHARITEEERHAYERLISSEQAMQSWEAEWDKFNQQVSEALRNEKGELTHLNHLELAVNDICKRIETLSEEHAGLELASLEEAMQALQSKLVQTQAVQQLQLRERAEKQRMIRHTQELLDLIKIKLDECQSQYQTIRGRLASLEALQQSALGRDQVLLAEWLQRMGFGHLPRLAQQISVDPGWETALETVLGVFLEAIWVEGLEFVARELPSLRQGRLTIIDSKAVPDSGLNKARSLGPRLSAKVSTPWPIQGLLNHIYAVESLEEALALRPQLLAYESIILRDGSWLGANWLRVNRDSNTIAGILKRDQEIKELEHGMQSLKQTIADHTAHLEQTRDELKRLEQESHALEGSLTTSQEKLGLLRSEFAMKQAELEQRRLRKQRIEAELKELNDLKAMRTAELEAARDRLESIRRGLRGLDEARFQLTERRKQHRRALELVREEWRVAREKYHAIAVRLESVRSQRTLLEQTLMRNRTLATRLTTRYNELQAALAEGETPLGQMEVELEQALERRIGVEAELGETRAALQLLNMALREQEQKRMECEQGLQRRRDELERARLEAQAINVRLQGLKEQVESSGFDLDALLAELPTEAAQVDWEAHLELLTRKIMRLGPVNLAAIDEHAELLKRKTYLDDQYADLSEALVTLENAIRKLDKETRARFKETFEKVNLGLQATFPRLFGGGHAYLELIDENLLETGVTVMARPPGKRNSTIHLLSGGEKALTALALVFALFELNPAPFCLLDEVDAPLDDTNVIRLCEMLKSMAKTTQFLIVTHNKITMEIAECLIGVTMQETGVSRLVAVDIDAAIKMAATSQSKV